MSSILTKIEFNFVFDKMTDSSRNYYFNKLLWSFKRTALGMVFPSKDIYRNHLERGQGVVETLLEYNRKQGRHVDFSERWVRSDDKEDTLLETSNDSKDLMNPKLVDEMYDWIIGNPDLLEEWSVLYSNLKEVNKCQK